jgi:hypothetical protein
MRLLSKDHNKKQKDSKVMDDRLYKKEQDKKKMFYVNANKNKQYLQ